MNTKTILTLVALLSLATAIANTAQADGDCDPRPLTAAEIKLYKDAYAAFVASAPAAPTGWVHNDSPATGEVPQTLCKEAVPAMPRWSFSRGYELGPEARKARDDKAMAGYRASMETQAKFQQMNKAKLDEVDRKLTDLTKKQVELVNSKKYEEAAALNETMAKLIEEKTALMGLGDVQKANDATAATELRDASASYELRTGADGSESQSFTPFAASVGKGYRQSYESKGNKVEDIAILFGAPSATAKKYPVIVRLHGDPERVAALLKAAKLAVVAGLAK